MKPSPWCWRLLSWASLSVHNFLVRFIEESGRVDQTKHDRERGWIHATFAENPVHTVASALPIPMADPDYRLWLLTLLCRCVIHWTHNQRDEALDRADSPLLGNPSCSISVLFFLYQVMLPLGLVFLSKYYDKGGSKFNHK